MSHRVHPGTPGHPPQPQPQVTDDDLKQQQQQQQQLDKAAWPPAGEPDVESPGETPPCHAETTSTRPSTFSKQNTQRLSVSGRVVRALGRLREGLVRSAGGYDALRAEDARW